MERLSRFTCGFSIKAEEGDGMSFSGYGAVFGNVDSYGDMILPGAFADSLSQIKNSGRWPVMLMQHGGYGMTADDMTPMGIWTDLSEDGQGLRVRGKLADTVRGREAYALMKMEPRPAMDGLSIGYIAKEWTPRSKPEEPRRTLRKIDLYEISLVTFPANPQARVSSVKSGITIRDAERALRDAGCSAREAKAILARGFPAQRDADPELSELAALLKRNVAALTNS